MIADLFGSWTKKIYWTAKDGRKLLPEEFDDQHLANTINHIEKLIANGITKKQLFYLGECQVPKGELAAEAFDQEAEFWIDLSVCNVLEDVEIYARLVKESKKRMLPLFEAYRDWSPYISESKAEYWDNLITDVVLKNIQTKGVIT